MHSSCDLPFLRQRNAEKTVKNYVSALFAELGMERRTQAAAYAVRVFDGQQAGRGERHAGPGD